MSFLQNAGAGAMAANGASTGLGRLIDVDPSRISNIANGIGRAANGIATAGGAPAAYDGSAGPQMQQQPNNYLQNLDPTVLRAIMAKFGPAQNTGMVR